MPISFRCEEEAGAGQPAQITGFSASDLYMLIACIISCQTGDRRDAGEAKEGGVREGAGGKP